MKKIFVFLCMVLMMSSFSFADDVKLKEVKYDLNVYSISNDENDAYKKSLDYLIEKGEIYINDGKIIEPETQKLSGRYDIDVVKEFIDENGKYYGVIPKNEIIKFRKAIANKPFIGPVRAEIFNYYDETLNNTILLSAEYNSWKNAVGEIIAVEKAGLYFAKKVRTRGSWDYKRFLGTNTSYYTEMKVYNGYRTGEAIGNMHYGTVGRYLFPESILKSAAGVYQIVSGTAQMSWFNSYFDDPRDQAQISEGIDLHSRFDFPTVAN